MPVQRKTEAVLVRFRIEAVVGSEAPPREGQGNPQDPWEKQQQISFERGAVLRNIGKCHILCLYEAIAIVYSIAIV
jgi:hypothetical protein